MKKIKTLSVGFTPFNNAVIEALKKIPRGKVTTYKYLALYVGHPRAVRAVGTAVGKNPFAPKIPCHRVVKSDGMVGGYVKGIREKIVLLEKEGILIKENKVMNFDKCLFKFI